MRLGPAASAHETARILAGHGRTGPGGRYPGAVRHHGQEA
jgi:hypothetical protein